MAEWKEEKGREELVRKITLIKKTNENKRLLELCLNYTYCQSNSANAENVFIMLHLLFISLSLFVCLMQKTLTKRLHSSVENAEALNALVLILNKYLINSSHSPPSFQIKISDSLYLNILITDVSESYTVFNMVLKKYQHCLLS